MKHKAKDYLNSTERLRIIALLNIVDMSKEFIESDLLTTKEKRRYKKSYDLYNKNNFKRARKIKCRSKKKF